MSDYYRQLQEVQKSPLEDRKQAAQEFGEAMRDPALVGERIGWLLDGNYGFEEMMAASRVLGQSARANKVASLTHMIGVLEWQCPPDRAVAEWKKLTKAEKDALDRAVKKEIAGESEAKRRLK